MLTYRDLKAALTPDEFSTLRWLVEELVKRTGPADYVHGTAVHVLNELNAGNATEGQDRQEGASR